MTPTLHEELWAAINHYAVSCGGSPATRVYGNETRQRAVARIERVAQAIETVTDLPAEDLHRCASCGCPALDHAVDDEELRECLSCECKQYVCDTGGETWPP